MSDLPPDFSQQGKALLREKDPEFFASGVLHLAGALQSSDHPGAALRLLASLDREGISEKIRYRAKELTASLEGSGSFGLGFENLLSQISRDSTQPRLLLPMLAATVVGGIASRWALAKFTARPVGGFIQGLAAPWMGRAFGLGLEGLTFTALGRAWGSDPSRSFGEELAGSYLMLGALRISGRVEDGIRASAALAGNPGWKGALANASSLLAFYSAQQLEGRLGLREIRQGSQGLLVSFGSWLGLKVGGHLGDRLLGPGLRGLQSIEQARPSEPWKEIWKEILPEGFPGGKYSAVTLGPRALPMARPPVSDLKSDLRLSTGDGIGDKKAPKSLAISKEKLNSYFKTYFETADYAEFSKVETALIKLGAPAVLPFLQYLEIQDEENDKCWIRFKTFASTLYKMSSSTVAELLFHPSEELRIRVAELFQYMGIENGLDSQVIPALIRALFDPSDRVQEFAIQALRKEHRAVEPLLIMLGDPSPLVSAKAALALGFFGDLRAVESLIQLLWDPNGVVREHAEASLIRLGHLAEGSLLRTAAHHPNATVRTHSAKILKKLVATAPRETTKEILLIQWLSNHDETVRLAAAKFLWEMDTSYHRGLLIPLLSDPAFTVRSYANSKFQDYGNADDLIEHSNSIISFGKAVLELSSENDENGRWLAFDSILVDFAHRQVDGYEFVTLFRTLAEKFFPEDFEVIVRRLTSRAFDLNEREIAIGRALRLKRK